MIQIRNFVQTLNKSQSYKSLGRFCTFEDNKRKGEEHIAELLRKELNATFVDIKDTSMRGSSCK